MSPSKLQPRGAVYVEARDLSRKGEWVKALGVLEQSPQAARDMTLHPGIAQALRDLKPTTLTLKVTLAQFRNVPIWNRTKVLLIHGPTGIGKTALAKCLLPKGLLINHVDQLRGYKHGVHEGVIYDECNIKHWPRESQIAWCDTDEDRAIHCRYAPAVLPSGTPRIMTSNLIPLGVLEAADPAIKRRLTCWEMESPKKFIVTG